MFQSGKILAGRADTPDDRPIVPKRVLLDVPIVRGVYRTPEDDLLSPPDAPKILPHQTPVAHFLAAVRAEQRTTDIRGAISDGHTGELEIVPAQVIVPRPPRMIRDEIVGDPHVPHQKDERATRRLAEKDRTDDQAVGVGEAVAAGHLAPTAPPGRLHRAARGEILCEYV